MSFLSYAIPQASYLTGGGHYVRGGSAALTNRVVALIREAGGIVEAGREVDTLLVNVLGVSGVRHRKPGDDGASVCAGGSQRRAHRLADRPEARDTFFCPARRPPSISL
jgi:phytoene dehydrogenase-like protein